MKTQPTRKSARRFLQGIEHAQRREDGLELLALFEEITGEKPVMWGDRNGQAARWPLTGFSPRKQNMKFDGQIRPAITSDRELWEIGR